MCCHVQNYLTLHVLIFVIKIAKDKHSKIIQQLSRVKVAVKVSQFQQGKQVNKTFKHLLQLWNYYAKDY